MTKKQKEVLEQAVNMLRNLQSSSLDERVEMADKLSKVRDELPSWLVIVLKTIAYLIGLLLAGVATSCTAQSLFNL